MIENIKKELESNSTDFARSTNFLFDLLESEKGVKELEIALVRYVKSIAEIRVRTIGHEKKFSDVFEKIKGD